MKHSRRAHSAASVSFPNGARGAHFDSREGDVPRGQTFRGNKYLIDSPLANARSPSSSQILRVNPGRGRPGWQRSTRARLEVRRPAGPPAFVPRGTLELLSGADPSNAPVNPWQRHDVPAAENPDKLLGKSQSNKHSWTSIPPMLACGRPCESFLARGNLISEHVRNLAAGVSEVRCTANVPRETPTHAGESS